MNLLAMVVISCLVGGCAVTPRQVVKEEPDTEWIVTQYQGHPQAEVDARRIREGW